MERSNFNLNHLALPKLQGSSNYPEWKFRIELYMRQLTSGPGLEERSCLFSRSRSFVLTMKVLSRSNVLSFPQSKHVRSFFCSPFFNVFAFFRSCSRSRSHAIDLEYHMTNKIILLTLHTRKVKNRLLSR